jgi:hypothetical protein
MMRYYVNCEGEESVEHNLGDAINKITKHFGSEEAGIYAIMAGESVALFPECYGHVTYLYKEFDKEHYPMPKGDLLKFIPENSGLTSLAIRMVSKQIDVLDVDRNCLPVYKRRTFAQYVIVSADND